MNFDELKKEISKRNYKNIVGLKADITEKEYDHFLEVLPPIYTNKGGFLLMEPLSHDGSGPIHYWFHGKTCQIDYVLNHVSFKQLVDAGMV